ncbi:LysR family transcriptional regulator [Novosphingobium profundi]|uniref:LysR family transcriptional regulator n=1 Tax=Novosphingobium profundi TaxID=1774954 RepID=UPI001FE6EE37|nr:LysR family transcriptional regulator [Novosphingobium profundi]
MPCRLDADILAAGKKAPRDAKSAIARHGTGGQVAQSPFTLRQLEVFAALCEAQTMRACAERLGISQACVSRQISDLEARLGTALFVRRAGRRPSLTAPGEAFRGDLAALDRAGRKLASHRIAERARTEKRTFRVRIGLGLFDSYVKPKLGPFLAAHPDTECTIACTHPVEELHSAQAREASDLALFHLREDWPAPPHCRAIGLVRAAIYGLPALAKGAPLPLTREAASRLPFILPQQGSAQERLLLTSLAEQDLVAHEVVCRTDYSDVLVAIAERGIGAACLLESVLPPSARGALVALYPLTPWKLVLYRNPSLHGPAADALEDFLVRAILEDDRYPALPLAHQPATLPA